MPSSLWDLTSDTVATDGFQQERNFLLKIRISETRSRVTGLKRRRATSGKESKWRLGNL